MRGVRGGYKSYNILFFTYDFIQEKFWKIKMGAYHYVRAHREEYKDSGNQCLF